MPGWHMWHITHWTHLDSWTNGALWPYGCFWIVCQVCLDVFAIICQQQTRWDCSMLLVALRSIHLYKYLQEWNHQWPHSPDCPVTLGLIRIERMNTSDAVALYRHHWECENTVTIMSRLCHFSLQGCGTNLMFYPKHWKTLFEIQRSNCHKLPVQSVHQVTWSRSKLGP